MGENVTKKKGNLRPFKFEPAQFVKSKRLFLQLNFLRFMQIQKEKVKGTVVCVSSINRRMMIIGAGFHVVAVQWTSKKCTKKRV